MLLSSVGLPEASDMRELEASRRVNGAGSGTEPPGGQCPHGQSWRLAEGGGVRARGLGGQAGAEVRADPGRRGRCSRAASTGRRTSHGLSPALVGGGLVERVDTGGVSPITVQ